MTTRFRISRRRFLGALAAAGGALLGAGVGLRILRGLAPAVTGLRAIDDGEYRTIARLAEALLPRGGPFPEGAEDFDLARRFDDFLADEPPWNQSDLRTAILLLEYGPVVIERRARTFSHLPPEERLAHFQRWRESDRLELRQASLALAKFLSLVFYDRPRVWTALRYPGPLVKAVD